jgi:hypothetical protein
MKTGGKMLLQYLGVNHTYRIVFETWIYYEGYIKQTIFKDNAFMTSLAINSRNKYGNQPYLPDFGRI